MLTIPSVSVAQKPTTSPFCNATSSSVRYTELISEWCVLILLRRCRGSLARRVAAAFVHSRILLNKTRNLGGAGPPAAHLSTRKNRSPKEERECLIFRTTIETFDRSLFLCIMWTSLLEISVILSTSDNTGPGRVADANRNLTPRMRCLRRRISLYSGRKVPH